MQQQKNQQFQQQPQNKTNSNELHGIVLQENDRYAGLSGFDSIPAAAAAAGQQNNPAKPQGLLGNEFDTNFSSMDASNFSNNSGSST